MLYYPLILEHLSRGTVLSSWRPFACRQNHVGGDFCILWLIANISSKWFERHEYLVSLSMNVLITFRTSHPIVIVPSVMLNFRLIYSIIVTTCNIPDSSLLCAFWFLACPGEV